MRSLRLDELPGRTPRELAPPGLALAGAVACVAVAAYWAWRIAAPSPAMPAAPAAVAAPAGGGEGAGLFGAQPARDQGLRVAVRGVIRPAGEGGGGAAVLSVADAAPRLVQAGREAAPGLVLAEVRARSVVLRRGAATQEVAMAPKRALPVLAATETEMETAAADGGPALVTNIPRASR
ncbi:hypothetical protein [Cupriavidus sp. WS]|uniref:hypothetical protein n=1 Tax=Cupriavidus sp. WS TaxID=1312922 RepID=UPI000367C92F|nr:hypothetical protein [Cupriavidus sp. WS]